MKPIQIFMADDHVLVRNGLAAIINQFENCRVTGHASNGKEVTEAFNKGPVPDVLLLDLNMPVMDGYETAKWVKEHHPGVRVLILTMYDSKVPIVRLLQTGVCGIVKKDIGEDELQAAIYKVAKGERYYSGTINNEISDFFLKDSKGMPAYEKGILSELEIDFLRLMAEDLTYKEIANELKITPKTVEYISANLFKKLNVKSKQGLVLFAAKHGIINI